MIGFVKSVIINITYDKFWKYPWKNPNTLNYRILFWDLAKFFQILFRYLKHLAIRFTQSIFETLLKNLPSEIVNIYFFPWQFLQLYFKYASEQILVVIWCLKYQILFKNLIRRIRGCKKESYVLKLFWLYYPKADDKKEHRNETGIVFCYQNCSDLLWEKMF